MSRGLGRLQRAVLGRLREAEGWCWTRDIALDLYRRWHSRSAPASPADQEEPPRSFLVSVRRAIHTLSERGLIQTGRVTDLEGEQSRHGLACWLPHHDEPEVKETVPRGRVEEIVMRALARAAEVDIEEWLKTRSPAPEREAASWRGPGAVPYSWLVREVRKVPGLKDNWVAINRAVKRLSRAGLLSASRWRGSRYVFIYLTQPFSAD